MKPAYKCIHIHLGTHYIMFSVDVNNTTREQFCESFMERMAEIGILESFSFEDIITLWHRLNIA